MGTGSKKLQRRGFPDENGSESHQDENYTPLQLVTRSYKTEEHEEIEFGEEHRWKEFRVREKSCAEAPLCQGQKGAV